MVTDSLYISAGPSVANARGLPGYTFERAAGELWRSRFDAVRNLIVVNSGHRDLSSPRAVVHSSCAILCGSTSRSWCSETLLECRPNK